MIQVNNIQVYNLEGAIRGMRNPMNSWGKSDSYYNADHNYYLGPNDLDLCCRLIKAGPEHRKFLRQIFVSMDINAPLYWWKEFDTYKVGTTANSCSTMHRIHSKEFTLDDFSYEHLFGQNLEVLHKTIDALNENRQAFIDTKDKDFWWQLIQLLPTSYNQLRTWTGSLETIMSICRQRDNHKLDEWRTFRTECFNNILYLREFYDAMTKEGE